MDIIDEYNVVGSPNFIKNIFELHENYVWMNDKDTNNCIGCNALFSYFTCRRHHCRVCLKIFCYYCCNDFVNIPELLKKPNISYTGYDRVCKICLKKINSMNEIETLVRIFLLSSLTILDLWNARLVCKDWNNAFLYIRNRLTLLAYKTGNTYDAVDKMIIKNNYSLFCGHSRLVTSTLNYDNSYINFYFKKRNRNKKITCSALYCGNVCNEYLTRFDYLSMFISLSRNKLPDHRLLTKVITKLDKQDMPLIFDIFTQLQNDTIYKVIISKIRGDLVLMYTFYWYLFYNKCQFYYRFKSLVNISYPELALLFRSQKSLVKKLINKTRCLQHIQHYELFNISRKLESDLVVEYKNIESYSKPYICRITDNYSLLLKHDNIKKEKFIINIIELCKDILFYELQDDFNILIYNILPYSNELGIVELVKDSITLYSADNILEYLLENNHNEIIDTIKMRFIKSTAAYSVITYLFGIGDRHLDNIMVTKTGILFHIDFGFIMGSDPIEYNTTNIKITTEMKRVIGDPYYNEVFENSVTKIYNTLRKYIDLFILLINPSKSELDKLYSRFLPNSDYLSANSHIVSKIRECNYIELTKDILHNSTKYYTFSNFTNVSNLFKS